MIKVLTILTSIIRLLRTSSDKNEGLWLASVIVVVAPVNKVFK